MRLLTKIWLSTSLVITALFGVTGWILSEHLVTETMKQLTAEIEVSLQAYHALWKARSATLDTLSGQMAAAPQVRAAFGTRDPATIADTSGDLLQDLERHLGEGGLVVVTDPRGRVIARFAQGLTGRLPDELAFVEKARARFPAQQSGFGLLDNRLFQFVITPVYVQSGSGVALINVLVTGFAVTDAVAAQLRLTTGSDIIFASAGRTFASTLGSHTATLLPLAGRHPAGKLERISIPGRDYLELCEPLLDVEGGSMGFLSLLRSLETAMAGSARLRRQIAVIWVASLGLSFLVTYWLARRIVRPIEALDNAAAEVARENYGCRVEPAANDELGRLARSFNHMCESIRQARQELIRNERLSTIGRLAGSIVHDLRNPLAAIYGGSEMLLHTELGPQQQKRLSANIYKASKKIQDMLDDLLNISRGKTDAPREDCLLSEILQAALDPLRGPAETQKVELAVAVPDHVLVAADRRRLERAFGNLLVNALEAMPDGGRISVDTEVRSDSIIVRVEDTGPGIPAELLDRLFQPFASAGKSKGTGLGLALARQTVLDQGGDMWAETQSGHGACLSVRLPLALPVASLSPDTTRAAVS